MVSLSACFNGSNSTSIANSQGSPGSTGELATLGARSEIIGQSSVTGATITVKAADGALLATTSSDAYTGYQAMVSDQENYPYIITATSGIDPVSGTSPGFPLMSIVTGPDDGIANINVFSTLIVKTAQNMPGGLTISNLDLAKQMILQSLNFGLDTSLMPDAMTTPVTTQNVSNLVKANQILSEVIRRTSNNLQVIGLDVTENDIISTIAADMTDGYLDGNGAGGSNALIAATANIVSGQVLVEGLSNNLNVNGTWAAYLLDDAIRAALPEATDMSADVTITAAMLQQTRTTISAAQAIDPSEALSTLALIVNSLNPGARAADIETVLPEERSRNFDDALMLATSASNDQLAAINTAVRQTTEAPADDKALALAWYSNPGDILGYIVYYGSTPDSATTIASETSGTAVKYYPNTELGLNPGDSVCFRLKAFNLAGLSAFSGAACMLI